MTRPLHLVLAIILAGTAISVSAAPAQQPKPSEVEWVYHVRYGFIDEWWRLFRKYQIATLDEQKRRGEVLRYTVYQPEMHAGEDTRWDYRLIVVYRDRDAASLEEDAAKAIFPDTAARHRDENRRWELTINHWDLPIHEVDPHAPD